MDWRWPILAGGVAAAGGAAFGAWHFRPEAITAAGAIGASVLAVAAVGFEAASRARSTAQLRREIGRLKSAQSGFESDITLAKDGMIAVHQALAEGGGKKMQAMADEVAVLQKLVGQLQSAASLDRNVRIAPVERASAVGLSPEQILDLVRAAVADGQVELFLQPIVTLPQRRKRYYECFSRIPDQRGGVLTADAYVAAAEVAGLIAPIDNLLLFRAVQLVRRARNKNAHVSFFCNVSRHTLKDSEFLSDFADFLDENAELAPSLILEIAQSDWDPTDADLARYMGSLTAMGVRFSLDRVTNFDLDIPMLRRRGFRFVKAAANALMADRAPDALRLRRGLAHEGLQLVVEKIESERDLVELLEYDIELGQGYLFGEPKAPIAAAA